MFEDGVIGFDRFPTFFQLDSAQPLVPRRIEAIEYGDASRSTGKPQNDTNDAFISCEGE